jgi:hypothetical protein
LIIPDGKGPFPVFLTNHSRRYPWLYTAVRRGYIGCYYAANDPAYGGGDTDDADRYIEIYPAYDFSCLARWAWSAARAVDYLVTLSEVDKSKIGLAGHSRHGKQSLLAAAFDERIGAVILSSGNTGECDPWRYTTDMFVNESIELLTGVQPHWFHPRLRFFAGREDKLPVDQNMLMALIAPRGLMIYSGYAESAGNPLGFEQAYRSVRRVYSFLGHEQNVWFNLRDGEHPTAVVDVEQFMDFLDSVFGRKHHPKVETWILGYTFEGWQQVSQEKIDPLSYPKRSVGDFLYQANGRLIGSVGGKNGGNLSSTGFRTCLAKRRPDYPLRLSAAFRSATRSATVLPRVGSQRCTTGLLTIRTRSHDSNWKAWTWWVSPSGMV